MAGFKPVKRADSNPLLTNTLWFSLDVLVSCGWKEIFLFHMSLTSEGILHISGILEDLYTNGNKLSLDESVITFNHVCDICFYEKLA